MTFLRGYGPVLLAAGALASSFLFACSSETGAPSSPTSATSPTGPAEAGPDGAALVAQNGCRDCHGQDLGGNPAGLGDRGFAKSFAPNLTADPSTGLGDWTLDQFKVAVTRGKDDEDATLCRPMPRFELKDAEVSAIYEYIRSLPKVTREVPESECPERAASEADGGS